MAEDGDGIRGAGSTTKGASKRTKSLNRTEDDVLHSTKALFPDHHPSRQQVDSSQATKGSKTTDHQQPTTTTKSIAEMMATTASSGGGGVSGTTRLPAAHHDASNRPGKSSSSLAQQDPPLKTSSSASQGKPIVQSPAATTTTSTSGGDGLTFTQKEDPDRHSSDGKYSIDDLPREVILKALNANYSGPVITSAECGVRGRCEVFLIDGWIILLVDRKSPFVSKNARDFISLVHALRKKHGNPGYRGAVLTRESALHRESKMTPFARSTQQSLLEQGIILLSIPDEAPSSSSSSSTDPNKNDPSAASSSSSSSGPTFSSQQNTVVVTTSSSLVGSSGQQLSAPSTSNQVSTTAEDATTTSESSGGPTMTAASASHVASPGHNKPSKVARKDKVVPEVPENGEETGEGEGTSSGEEEEEEDN